MKGKWSFENLGKQADKGFRAVEGAVLREKSAKQKVTGILEDAGAKLEELVDSVDNKIDSVVDAITLSTLTVRLGKQHERLQDKITKHHALLKKQSNSTPADALNTRVKQLNSMNDYIKDYPNSIWLFTDQQKIQATNMAIKAYEIIDKIIKNPNASINKYYEAAILEIKDRNIQIGIFCIVAGLLVLGVLALLAVTLNLAVLTFSTAIITSTLSVIAGGFVLNQGRHDNDFCNAFQITTPTFFGKQMVSKSAEDSNVKQPRQDKRNCKI